MVTLTGDRGFTGVTCRERYRGTSEAPEAQCQQVMGKLFQNFSNGAPPHATQADPRVAADSVDLERSKHGL